MANIFINLFLVGLLLLCCVMVLIILMQRPSANAGMGASLGGGAAESVFGGETANVLLKNTIRIAVGFFVVSFLLFLWIVARADHTPKVRTTLPKEVPGTTPAAVTPGVGNATSAATIPAPTNPTVTSPGLTTGNTATPAAMPAVQASGNTASPAAP